MSTPEATIDVASKDSGPGRPLSPWTYLNPEVFELEYEAFFLRRWQFVCHASQVTEPGDYATAAIGRDSVFVLRDKSGELHAFLNVCRHRAARLLEGNGNCRGVLRCPYHGWTYRLDGSLMAIPQEETFAPFDRGEFGLHEIQLEDFHGLLFVRVKGDGPSVTESFAQTGAIFGKYDVSSYVPIAETQQQVWEVNWKVAWDNYLENYHIPIGHPGLFRLVETVEEDEAVTEDVCYGVFRVRDKLSYVAAERRYQKMFHHSFARIPEELHRRWVQFAFSGSLGLDLYPEMIDLFQIVPLAPDRTLIRATFFGHENPSPEETELRRLNLEINAGINDEDKFLCERVQRGLAASDYEPGPLSSIEGGVCDFHELVRKLVPVTRLSAAPVRGQVAAENTRMSG